MSATKTPKQGQTVGRKVVCHAKTTRSQHQAEMARTRAVDPMILPMGLTIDSYGGVVIDHRYRELLLG